MISSEIFRSKFSANSISDHHQAFLMICDRIQVLEELRVVERLARPLVLWRKETMMEQVNGLLTSIEE
jgi:hypothetical protein